MKAEEFTPVSRRLRPRLMAVARQFDADAAEDAVQEAMMRLWAAWGELPCEEDAERLAVRLTKHACIDAFRQRKKRHQTIDNGQWSIVNGQSAAAAMADYGLREEEMRAALDRAVDALPPAERRLWRLFTEAQMDRRQIEAATGTPARSVSTMLGKARRRIIEALRKGGML